MDTTYFEFAMLLLLSAGCGAIAALLRQPLILAFIAVGIVVGPAGFGWVRAHDQVDLLAQIGVTVLLFVVGLKLDLHLVRHLGPVALATGIGQLVFTTVFGFLIALALGMSVLEALYVAVALTFSSTIIIVKLLSDKREIDSLHGRIAMGFLIVQDLAVVVAMMVLGSLRGEHAAGAWLPVLLSVATRLAAATAIIAVLMRYVLPGLMAVMARSQELLLLFAIAWATTLAACGEIFGFSKEVGAFLAGFSLASTPFRESTSARLTSVRDFLLLFFFLDLGSRLELAVLGDEVTAAVALSLFVLIGNPLIVMAIMGYMGYRKRTGFLAGLTVAQISEFSIVFVAMGLALGHVGVSALALVTLVGLITITLSTYMIMYSEQLYARIAPWLGLFERRRPYRELAVERQRPPDEPPRVIVFGLGRYGGRIMQQLRALGVPALGVDFDPEVVRAFRRGGYHVRFGSAEDPDFPAALPLADTRMVVSTLPQVEVNVTLANALAAHGYRGPLAATSHDERDCTALRRAGIPRVLRPYQDAADFTARRIAEELGAAARAA